MKNEKKGVLSYGRPKVQSKTISPNLFYVVSLKLFIM